MRLNEQFFYDNAGFSYRPETQTAEEGHVQCAKALAAAELEAKAAGVWFDWFQDDEYSSTFCDETPVRPLWVCRARNAKGEVVATLSSIDLGQNTPYQGPAYCRVVEAELAIEVLS